MTALALPSEGQQVHRALADIRSDNPTASAWHATYAAPTPDVGAADLTVLAAAPRHTFGGSGQQGARAAPTAALAAQTVNGWGLSALSLSILLKAECRPDHEMRARLAPGMVAPAGPGSVEHH